MTRLRYQTKDDGTLESTKWLQAGNRAVMVRINLKAMTYSIVEESGLFLVKEAQATDKQTALKEVKQKLKELGVRFYDELRKREK